LGLPFDIHGGGYDLIFPHHENEIAQTEALLPDDERMTNVWMHGGLLNFDGRKMSKSIGNFEPLLEILARHDPLAIRLLFLQTGYRKPMNFNEESIAGATAGLERLRRFYDALGAIAAADPTEEAEDAGEISTAFESNRARFFEALDDDLNTSGALAAVFDIAALAPAIVEARGAALADAVRAFMREAFALFGIEAALTRELPAPATSVDPAVLERLRAVLGESLSLNGEGAEAAIARVIDARNEARRTRDFARADHLRDALAAAGIALTDGKDGTTWTVAGG
jgi:cysteinyl-tRNA synthetase